MFVYIDETGDLGFGVGSTSHFTISALVFDNSSDKHKLEQMVRRTRKRKVPHVHELKGCDMNLQQKLFFWQQIHSIPFSIYSICVKKKNVNHELRFAKSRLYNWITRKLIDKIPLDKEESSLHIEIDRSKNAYERKNFNRYIRAHIEARVDPNVKISIFHESSIDSRCIQAIDIFSHGIHHKYASNDSSWYDIFKDKVSYCPHFFSTKVSVQQQPSGPAFGISA